MPFSASDYWSHGLRVKICGITTVEQGVAIATLGPHALGFICVPNSPRYITPAAIGRISQQLPTHTSTGIRLARIGVFVDAPIAQVEETVIRGKLTGLQLHGNEPPAFCQSLRTLFPDLELIKAFRVRTPATLQIIPQYTDGVDAILLDAYTENHLGGTGCTWDWSLVRDFSPPCPWFLAGGLQPNNIQQALHQTQPDGIDLSSGVELSPGNKDLEAVQTLFATLAHLHSQPGIG